MSFYRHFDLNTAGRDFVVGDVHGCFDHLRRALLQANFNEQTDRLFSVGDLVDRGPTSHEAVDWLARPWFFAVRGNHEQLVIEADLDYDAIPLHLVNGGRWLYELPEDERQMIARCFTQLPVAIDIDTPCGLVGIVHAEPVGNDWGAFVGSLKHTLDPRTEGHALWARTRIAYGDVSLVSGVERIYVGHTILESWRVLGNVHYIDTGAFNGGDLTLVCLTDDEVVQEAA